MAWTWSCRLSFLSYRLLFVSFFLQSFTDYYFDECINKLQTASVCRTCVLTYKRHTARPPDTWKHWQHCIENVFLWFYFCGAHTQTYHTQHMHMIQRFSAKGHVFFNVSHTLHTFTSLNCNSLINLNCEFFRTWSHAIASFILATRTYQPIKMPNINAQFSIYLPQSHHSDNALILSPLPVPKVFAPWLNVYVYVLTYLIWPVFTKFNNFVFSYAFLFSRYRFFLLKLKIYFCIDFRHSFCNCQCVNAIFKIWWKKTSKTHKQREKN